MNDTINRRRFIAQMGLSAAGLMTLGCIQSKSSRRPNVLFIAVDDLNDWIGCMKGHPDTQTPNIDRLAARSVLFTNAHCQAPICGPSRASLMSGLRPSTTGIYGQIKDADIRESNAETRKCTYLMEYFRNHGYKTFAKGKLFHEHVPDGTVDVAGGREGGFGPKPPKRLQWDQKGTSTDWGAFPDSDEEMPDYRTAKWAVARLQENHEKPFFIGAGFVRPHVPWHVPQKWFDMHPAEKLHTPPYLPDDYDDLPEIAIKLADVPMMPTTEWAIRNNQWKNIVQAYLACVSFVDHYIGEVLSALENSPYKDNTMIVLWGDHGYHLGEKNRFAKHSIWERATRAPLMFSIPGEDKGSVCAKPVQMLDIYPTLVDICGLPANEQNEGHSLKPLIWDAGADWPYMAVTTYARNNHAVRSEFYRYIRYEDGSEELYDHRSDDNEWHNLAGQAEMRPVIDELRKHLPVRNEPWAKTSIYEYNEYLTEQRKRELAD